MRTQGLRWVVPVLMFGAIAFLLKRNQAIVEILFANKSQVTLLIGFFATFIVGPVWIGYSRLNSLDPTDGLRSSQSENIRRFGFETKKRLVLFFLFCALFIVLALVGSLLSASFPEYRSYIVAVVVSAMITFFVFSIIRIVKILLLIESTIGNVARWRLEQKDRAKQIDQLKKGRAEVRVTADEGLLRYRELGYVAEEESSSTETQSIAAPEVPAAAANKE